MRYEPRRLLARARHGCAALVVIGVAIALVWLAERYPVSADLSANERYSLSAPSIRAVQSLAGDLVVTAYLPPKHQARAQVRDLVARYQRHAPGLKLTFVDPSQVPDAGRAEQVGNGALMVTANGRRERVAHYTEEAMTQALMRLLQSESHWVVFTTGHGERSPLRAANFDLSHWAQVLKGRGYRTQELNLAQQAAIPDNTSVLVLASPQLPFLPGEIRLVVDYVARGGALLWLMEPDTPHEFGDLARALGFTPTGATAIDPITQALGIDNPAVAVITRYPEHPALEGLTAAALLPFATPLEVDPLPGWHATPLLETDARAWGETGPVTGKIGFDAKTDRKGPLVLGFALTRPQTAGEQRIIVLGDGDFLSNTYIGNGANQDLGTRCVDWLLSNDALIRIETRIAPDVSLELTRWQQAVIGFGFLLVLPLAFALNGILLGWRRRRA
jgi:ABC-type uncharacterized transport system involved in gliding motility auxiliary subunit